MAEAAGLRYLQETFYLLAPVGGGFLRVRSGRIEGASYPEYVNARGISNTSILNGVDVLTELIPTLSGEFNFTQLRQLRYSLRVEQAVAPARIDWVISLARMSAVLPETSQTLTLPELGVRLTLQATGISVSPLTTPEVTQPEILLTP
jgi:hypothetical protein